MFRRPLTLAAVALIALGATSCSSDDSASSTTSAPATSTSTAAPTPTLAQAEATSTAQSLLDDYYANLTCSEKDADAYGKLLADSFLSVTATGVKDKAAVLDGLAKICYENASVTEVQAHQAPGVLVAPYVGKVDADGVSQPASQRVNVFVKNGDMWDGVLFASASPIATDSVTPSTTAAPSTSAAPQGGTADQKVGQQLVGEYYSNLTCGEEDAAAYAKLLDDSFVSITSKGVKDRDQVLGLLKGVCYTDATTSDVQTVRTGKVLVVTYKGRVDVAGTTGATTQRVNVFVDQGGTWKGLMFVDAGSPA